MEKKSYIGVDIFRIIAALMVCAIHTSPLSSFNPICDLVLTRSICRLAVPFFFITSGYFTISQISKNSDKFKAHVKKLFLIYVFCILLYLPINIYNGYFTGEGIVYKIISAVTFNGTFYHLWYFPASIIGSCIAFWLVRKLGYKKSIVIGILLYIIGMFGDSYYGISELIKLKGFYRTIFEISSYTRNGIFFSPLFYLVGGFIKEKRNVLSLRISITGFILSISFMSTEALILHHFNICRHDSMYLFLVPSVFFLFEILLIFKGKQLKGLRIFSLVFYIIHPIIIALIPVISRWLKINIICDNSIIHYTVIVFASSVVSLICTFVMSFFEVKKENFSTSRAWIEIDMQNLKHNAFCLGKILPDGCEIMAVLKREAYGHGAVECAKALSECGITAFATATIEEAVELRKYGVKGKILILGYTDPKMAGQLKKYDITQTLISYEYAAALNRQGKKVKAHIKIDSGMHRLGINWFENETVKKLFNLNYIKINGIYTHLCCADSQKPENVRFTESQIRNFYSLVNRLKENGIKIPKIHIQSSYGVLNYPELKCDYARFGIALYGCLSKLDDETLIKPEILPVLSLKSRVILIRELKKGESVGYGRDFIAQRDSKIAVLPIGYGDGLPREVSNGEASVEIGNYKCPIVGRICMDQLTVDITDAYNIRLGDIAIIIGKDTYAENIANDANTITNEILSRMGSRLAVVVKD